MGPGNTLREMRRIPRISNRPSATQGSSGEPANWRHGRQSRGSAHFNDMADNRGYHASFASSRSSRNRRGVFHGRKLTMRRYSPLLDQDNILLFYIKKPLYSRENSNKREREIQNRSRVDFLLPTRSSLTGRCGSTPSPSSQDTMTRPVRSRTSPIILKSR